MHFSILRCVVEMGQVSATGDTDDEAATAHSITLGVGNAPATDAYSIPQAGR